MTKASSTEAFVAKLPALAKEAGVEARLFTDAPEDWAAVWRSVGHQPVSHCTQSAAYQLAYFRGAGWDMADGSLVIYHAGKPCGIVPLHIGGPDGEMRVTASGGGLVAPLFDVGVAPKTASRLEAGALALFQRVGAEAQTALTIEQKADPFAPNAAMSDWHLRVMAAGAKVRIVHDVHVDLRKPIDELKRGMRKSFKALINTGLRDWDVFVMDAATAERAVWDAFQALHFEAAGGRATRAQESWDVQFDNLCAGHAFLVGLRDPSDGRLVGAGYFMHTAHEAIYAVAAYDRDLFDKPLGHGVQFRAIEVMQAKGLVSYWIGRRPFAHDVPEPSAKEMNIGFFKAGFSPDLFATMQYKLDPEPAG